jgi:hypothetical protein
MGRLIPAGTGLSRYRSLKLVAEATDTALLKSDSEPEAEQLSEAA